MKNKAIVILVVCAILLTANAVQGSALHQGKLVVFLGGDAVGYEEFSISPEGITTQASLTVAGQTIALETRLTRDSYELKQMGVTLTGKFADGSFQVAAGPVQLSYGLAQPYFVLDNNVFAQYQQVIDLAESGAEEVQVVTPVLVLMSQPPVLTGKVWKVGAAAYEVDGQVVELEEYGALLAGSVYVRILAHEGNLVLVEVPAQMAKAALEGYEGLKPVEEALPQGDALRTEEFRVQSGDITLAGTLTLPEGQGPFPAILLNSGSGPQDRDGNTPPALMTNMFKIMAEEFSSLGVAVLRYDERGVGESTGDYNAATFTDLMNDIRALMAYLKNHPSIDSQRIAMLGHSEGAYFAPIIASEDPELAGIILLGAPSASLDKIMIEQLEYQAGLEYLSEAERGMIGAYLPLTEQVIADARAGKAESVLPYNLDWLREHMAHDPLAVIANVTQPVLLIHGENDLKVLPSHAEQLQRALLEAGNGQVELHVLPKVTHEFMLFPLDNPAHDPTDPWKTPAELYDIIGSWLRAVLLD
ncbi:MAG TPA: prolyl oligopeptidase family serine peptidase [Firmicutes bacterium]|nr:prolyl oligopeptidase family serine peptidase [Bacillota bacterium]